MTKEVNLVKKKVTKSPPPTSWRKIVGIALVVIGIFLAVSVLAIRITYDNALKPVSGSLEVKIVTVEEGDSTREIASNLQEAGVIKKAWAFEWYVRNKGFKEDLKAGTYAIRPSQSTPEITDMIVDGRIATDLITILPGKRIDQVRKSFIDSGFKEAEVDAAFEPNQYKDHPALVDKPIGASLEGYLYPESFQKTADTKPTDIVRASLDEMQKRLTPQLREAIVRQGLTPYEGIILASIVEKEVSHPEDKAKAAQVFLRRLREGIVLASDATTSYGAILVGQVPTPNFESAYNSYNNGGLTPTPISNVTISSLQSVAFPANTNYLYFVSGDDGTTHFSHTLEEHETAAQKYCKELCGR